VVESTVGRGGVVELTLRDGRAFPHDEVASGWSNHQPSGQAGGAGAHGLINICLRPRRRALNLNGLGRVTKSRGSTALAFVFAVGATSGAAPERPLRSDREA